MKSEPELREIRRLQEAGTAYEDFPDGATWDDLDDAMSLPTDPED